MRNQKGCVKTCAENNKYFYHPITKECVDTCEYIDKYPFQKEPAVFPHLPVPCLAQCPSDAPYYSFDSNVCVKRCGDDGTGNKYHRFDEYVCYSSCIDISNGKYLYEYLEDSTYDVYSCYDQANKPSASSGNCPFYYLKDDGTKKCQRANECKDRNYIYLLYEECRDRCDEYYKLEVDIEYLPFQTATFIRCFNTLNECFGTEPAYYFENLKKCWRTFPSGYFIKNDITPLPIKNELVEKCEKFYYVDDKGRKICTDDCQTHNLFFVKGNNKCETDCLLYQKNYYDPANNECLDTCEGRDPNKFQRRLPNNPTNALSCLQQCYDSTATPANNYPFYDSDSNICLVLCGQDDPNKKYHAINDYACYFSCAEISYGDYLYEYNDICYPSLPTGSDINCDSYYTKSDGTKKCITKYDCINVMKFIYFIGIECLDDCDGYFKLEIYEGNLHYYQCYDSTKEVLKADNDVKAYNLKNKLCWKDIPDGYFVNNKQAKTGGSGLKYEVVEECDFFYYLCTDQYDTSLKYNECTFSCTDNGLGLFYISGQKNCEDSCSKFNKHYFNPETNQCLDTCQGLINYGYGRIIEDDGPLPCIENCEAPILANQYLYYDYDSNTCIRKCGDDNSINLYHASDGHICYPSCNNIPAKDYKYESLDKSDKTKICYEALPTEDCPYYYMKKDGSFKCLNDVSDCLNLKYDYLLGKECKTDCIDHYLLEDIDDALNLIQCFKTKSDCLLAENSHNEKVKYYNKKLKKCWIYFPRGYFINQLDTINQKYEVVEECENFYYPDVNYDNHYRCVEKCEFDTYLYFYKEDKNCEESCKAFNKYYKDPNNNECLDTCIGRKTGSTFIEFANQIDYNAANPVVDCKPECDNDQHYNYGTKICLNGEDCDSNKFIKHNELPHACYDSCSEIPGGNNIYEIGNECYIKEDVDFDTQCPFYYKKDDKTFKCVDNEEKCQNVEFNYVYKRECKKNCDNYYKLIDGNHIIKCYENYENAFEENRDFIYYDITLKQCWKNLPDGYFIKHDNNGENYEIVQTCEKYYYENTANNNYNYCIDNCKDKNLFFIQENKKCESSCSNNDINKLYFDQKNNECLDTCVGKINFEYDYRNYTATNTPQQCISKCPNQHFITTTDNKGKTHYECVDNCPFETYIYLDIKTKECLESCPEDKYIKVNDICYPKCDVINDYLYINTDTYDCLKACPSSLKKEELLATLNEKDVYLCKSHCEENLPFRLDDKCLEKCPEDHNYIGYNNICKLKCSNDYNGEHYYPINEDEPHDYLIYKCIDSCNEAKIDATNNSKNYLFYTESEPTTCLRQCPNETHFYLGSNPNECISSCPYNFPFYDNSNNNYECKANTYCAPDKYFLDGDCVFLENCTTSAKNKKYVDSRNICMEKCPNNEIKSKIKSYDNTYKCLRNCLGNFILQINIGDEPECVEYCPKEKNYIGLDDICKTSCGEEDGLYYYKYDEKIDPDSNIFATYNIYKCINACEPYNEGYKLKEVNNGNQCYQSCTTDYPYLSVEENLCYDNCLKSGINPFTLSQNNTCAEQCDENTDYKYWGENKNCIDSCSKLSGTTIIDYDNKCIEKCNLSSTYKYELNGKCYDTCNQTGVSPAKLRYSIDDYRCRKSCYAWEYIINENQCVTTCETFINITATGEKECISGCPEDKKYYYKNQNVCLEKCNTGDKIVQDLNLCVNSCNEVVNKIYYLYETEGSDDTFSIYDMCVERCPTHKPYILGGKCVEICPEDNKYFVGSETKPICLNDCPENYSYYTITIDSSDSTKKYYPCKADCPGYFVEDINPLIFAKHCLNDCPDTTYTDYIYKREYELDGANMRQCYKECPVEYKYHFDLSIDTETDNNCYKECPSEKNTPYYVRGENTCKKQSELHSGYLLYDIKEWTDKIIKCPREYSLYSQTEEQIIIIIYMVI